MTKIVQTVWTDKEGNEVLREKKAGVYYVPLADVPAEQLEELGAAIRDALAEHYHRNKPADVPLPPPEPTPVFSVTKNTDDVF